ncbi:AI-2E family transporter [Candidatus Peregrinibacteria bacterium]|nr:AI-2E family transporter [Candidatus Peregrinibacteria bacterium]
MPRKAAAKKTGSTSASRPFKGKNGNGVVLQKFPGYFLLACTGLLAFFLLQIFWPFIEVLILAAILATAVYPLYKWVLKVVKGREKIASFTTCILVLIFIVVPLIVFFIMLGRQALDAYGDIQTSVSDGVFDPYLKWEEGGLIYDGLGFARDQLGNVVDFDSLNIRDRITETAQMVAGFLATKSAAIVQGLVWLLIQLFVLLFAMYYFFKDAKVIIEKIMTLSPLPRRHEDELFEKFQEISHAALYGIFLTAVVQGVIGGIGFAIVGIPSALFWGTAIALFSLVPVLGTATIWFPASIVLLLMGNVWGGVFLFFYGLLIVSTADNFFRAYFIGERIKMNQLLIFLAVFGGIGAFGLLGVIFGPLILTFFFAFLHIYEKEYDKVLHRQG